MRELIAAAKAVVDRWDNYQTVMDGRVIYDLRAAVERAENQTEMTIAVKDYTDEISGAYAGGYNAGQQAERERVKEIIQAIGVQGEHDQWFDACDTIMQAIDADEH